MFIDHARTLGDSIGDLEAFGVRRCFAIIQRILSEALVHLDRTEVSNRLEGRTKEGPLKFVSAAETVFVASGEAI